MKKSDFPHTEKPLSSWNFTVSIEEVSKEQFINLQVILDISLSHCNDK